MDRRFTPKFELHGGWWAAWVKELPGANAQGRTLDEARENLEDAVALILEANRDLAKK